MMSENKTKNKTFEKMCILNDDKKMKYGYYFYYYY